MPDFSADVVGAQHELAVDDDSGADAGSDIDGEEIFELPCSTEVVFPPCNGVEIVCDSDRDVWGKAVEFGEENVVEVNVVPVEVGGVDDGVFINVDLPCQCDADACDIIGIEVIVGDVGFEDVPNEGGDISG